MANTEMMKLLTNIRENIEKAKDNDEKMQKKLVTQEAEIERLHKECSEANGRALTLSMKIIALKDNLKPVKDIYEKYKGFEDFNRIDFCYDMLCADLIPELISAIKQSVETIDEY